jgi:hypothetical protein
MDWDKMSNLYRGPSIDASYLPSFNSLGQSISGEDSNDKKTWSPWTNLVSDWLKF